MKKEFKKQLEGAKTALDRLIDEIEDEVEDFADDSKLLWRRSKKQFDVLSHRLSESAEKLETNTDDALLQAHLAAMDASDHWQLLKGHLTSFSHLAQNKTQTAVDHAALQAHLAKMDARDFMAGPGKELAAQFEASKDKSVQVGIQATAEIKEYCKALLG